MKRHMAAIFAALALAALASATALAHEDSELGEYRISVGFLTEPAYEGAMNAVEVRVSKPMVEVEEDSGGHHHGGASGGDHSHSHSTDMAAHDTLESEVPVSVKIAAEVEDGGGVNVRIMTENWLWAPESVDAAHEPGSGHAHIYVDGVKVGRVYGPDYKLIGLESGERHIRVTLNSNDHKQLTVGGEPVEASVVATIPGAASHAEPEMVGVEGLENTLRAEITHVASGAARTLDLRASPGTPGRYEAALIPTSPGHYRIRLFGEIEGEAIDQTFNSKSGGGDFDDVVSAADIQFPAAAASNRELEAAARGAQADAVEARNAALSAEAAVNGAARVGIAGVVLGAVGVAVGGAGLALAAANRRRG